MDNNKKEEKLNDDFDEIDERLTAGWYVCSGQRKRYLKSIIKNKKGYLSCIANIVIPATNPATKLAKTVTKPSYSLVGDLHGMQGAGAQISLASLNFFNCLFPPEVSAKMPSVSSLKLFTPSFFLFYFYLSRYHSY